MHAVIVRQGTKFVPEYVRMLKGMFREHAGITPIVLGDQKDDADVPLRHGFTGWHSILEIFSPEFEYRPCLYVDLDTYLLRDIRDLLVIPQRLTLIRDFYHPQRGNAGVMLIPKETGHIWANARTKSPPGNYLNQFPHDYMQDRFTGIKSYKADHLQNDPKNARICCFHGVPKPPQTDGWARETWQKWTQ